MDEQSMKIGRRTVEVPASGGCSRWPDRAGGNTGSDAHLAGI